MTKDEMKDRISMALKDPVLHQGFEIICKRLVILEKENAELKSKLGLSIECDKAQKGGELCLGYGGYEEEPCEQCKNCIKCECGYYQLGETEKDDQLIKAKEIIKSLIDTLELIDGEQIYELSEVKEAEQFLNSEVSE